MISVDISQYLSISVVLHSPNHVSQSLVVFEEIIRVALVRVVIFLNTTHATRLSIESHLSYLVPPPAVDLTSVALSRRRLAHLPAHSHNLHRQEVILARLPAITDLPARLDEESEVVVGAEVCFREPELLARWWEVPVSAGCPGSEGEVRVMTGRYPGVPQPLPRLPPPGVVVLAVPRRGAHTGSSPVASGLS